MKNRLYISTIASDDMEVCEKYALGLEIAEYCTARNMDENFAECDRLVRAKLAATSRAVFHAPFNELTPAAIDPKILAVTRERYEQALALAMSYGVRRMVVHSGYTPLIYHKSWFLPRSVEFWSDFLRDKPDDVELLLENVMEDSPELLREVVERVNDRRLRLCLDVGHANTIVSNAPVLEWVEKCAPLLSHVHLHNNRRAYDAHAALGDGDIPMEAVLRRLGELSDTVTYTVENMLAAPSLEWLCKKGFI